MKGSPLAVRMMAGRKASEQSARVTRVRKKEVVERTTIDHVWRGCRTLTTLSGLLSTSMVLSTRGSPASSAKDGRRGLVAGSVCDSSRLFSIRAPIGEVPARRADISRRQTSRCSSKRGFVSELSRRKFTKSLIEAGAGAYISTCTVPRTRT